MIHLHLRVRFQEIWLVYRGRKTENTAFSVSVHSPKIINDHVIYRLLFIQRKKHLTRTTCIRRSLLDAYISGYVKCVRGGIGIIRFLLLYLITWASRISFISKHPVRKTCIESIISCLSLTSRHRSCKFLSFFSLSLSLYISLCFYIMAIRHLIKQEKS